ncbi:MAG: hypothetical protein DRJ42_20745 [Deltaproteobacteria bacterium]|nr:MAG: hypothetical protein DRJ42_20745 [Deltaproteobacteria bacterium]
MIAHYTFDTDGPAEVRDAVGGHHGSVAAGRHCDVGACDTALCFDGTEPGVNHAMVPHSPDFLLEKGAVEFFAQLDSLGSFGLVSRDAFGAMEPGHLTVMTTTDGHVVFRLQVLEGAAPPARWLCSRATVEVGRPFHVGVSWGGPGGVRLFLNGSDELYVGGGLTIDQGGPTSITCVAAGAPGGIEGNSEPWYFGVYAGFRRPDTPYDLRAPLHGTIDEVRIHNAPMNFGGP